MRSGSPKESQLEEAAIQVRQEISPQEGKDINVGGGGVESRLIEPGSLCGVP